MWLHRVLTGVQVLCSLVIIGLVLIQRGKGADAGAGFGAGASGTVFGARGAGTALSRATAIAAAVFMLNSLALAYFGTQKTQEPKTILDQPLETTGAPPGRYFARFHGDREKLSPYECGFEAFEDTRMRFDVRYYLVAILFIVFDLEIAFLFPWAVALRKIGAFGLIAMGVFLAILVVGFIYEWRKGALEWD